MTPAAPPRDARVTPPRAEVRIDLGAYRRNVMALRDRLSGGAQLWAVVKANAYGHDVDRLAQEAVAAGAKRLCVATLSEARQLRQDGIRASILVMGPLDEPSLRRAVDIDASVTVLSETMVDDLERAAAGAAWSGRRVARVHLKVDTGMGRWGVHASRAQELLERLVALDGVEVEGVMTHFATADDLDDGGFFERQLERFEAIVSEARQLAPGIVAHAANSAATLRDPRAHFDAVRCGVATYGLDPMQADPGTHGLRPVLTLRSHVADVRELAPGESTGYCRSFVATEPTLVAEVPIGYADGVRRALANRGAALVRGTERPIVGNVSMDHLSLQVDAAVRVGDVVTLIGTDGDAWIGAEHHAGWADTINYEVTCGIAGEPRLLRAHVQEH
ncbi:MAG: alanine racemase [Thermoleophilia bacterium]|nr:alanine racemase [Thermoleophilia bacterium]